MRPYTLDEVLEPYLQYPKTIQEAVLRAHTHPAFLCLTRSYRKVLCQLLTRASRTDGQAPLKARIDRLAAEAGVSTKTVQRCLSQLQSLGWLILASDGRSEYGGVFCARMYQFTCSLCELVSLPFKGSPAQSRSDETKMSDGPYIDLSFKKDLREISIKNREKSKEPINLPDSLKPLLEFGVRDTGICKLRALARQAGHRLEDVFVVAKERLSAIGAKGGRVFCYLLSLLRKSSDYAGRARQLENLLADRAAKVKATSRATQYRYKRFMHPSGAIVELWDGNGEIRTPNGDIQTLAGPALEKVYDHIEAGLLKEVIR